MSRFQFQHLFVTTTIQLLKKKNPSILQYKQSAYDWVLKFEFVICSNLFLILSITILFARK